MPIHNNMFILDCSKELDKIQVICLNDIDSPIKVTDSYSNPTDSHSKRTDSYNRPADSPNMVADSHSKTAVSHNKATDSLKAAANSSTEPIISCLVLFDTDSETAVQEVKNSDIHTKITDWQIHLKDYILSGHRSGEDESSLKGASHQMYECDITCLPHGEQRMEPTHESNKSRVARKTDVEALAGLLSKTSITETVTTGSEVSLPLLRRAPGNSQPTQYHYIPPTPHYVWGQINEQHDTQPIKYMRTGGSCLPGSGVVQGTSRDDVVQQTEVNIVPNQIDLTAFSQDYSSVCDSVSASTSVPRNGSSPEFDDFCREYFRLKQVLNCPTPNQCPAAVENGTHYHIDNNINNSTVCLQNTENIQTSYHCNDLECFSDIGQSVQSSDIQLQSPVIDSKDVEEFFKDFFKLLDEEQQVPLVLDPELLATDVTETSCKDGETRALCWVSSLSVEDIQKDYGDGDNIVHMVIILQEVYLLKALLARLQREGLLSVLINKWNNDKQTPLYLAIALTIDDDKAEFHEKITKQLLQNGADVSGWSCHTNDPMKGVIYQNPLHLAASLGRHDILDILLKTNADNIDKMNNILETPLHCAIRKHGLIRKHKEKRDCRGVLRILKTYNANFNAKTKMNKTILHMVAEKGDHMLMSFLLDLLSPEELSAIINEQDDNGNTVLHIACGLEAQPTVERVTAAKVMICQLLKKGADERIKNRENKVAYNFVPKSCLSQEMYTLFTKRQRSSKSSVTQHT